MKAKSNVQLTEIPFGGKDGLRWNSLHSEREEICETIAKEKSITTPSSTNTQPSNDLNSTENWHRELLQARLKKLDEALDRVMSGSYGNCLTCGKGLSDVALKLDPAIAFCADCWADEQRQTAPFVTAYDGSPTEHAAVDTELVISSLARFDTIVLQTRNSAYRIFLLDPTTGRCLVEGGKYFSAPMEAVVSGSIGQDRPFCPGKISTGLRLELMIDEKQLITSPIMSLGIRHHNDAEVPVLTTAGVH